VFYIFMERKWYVEPCKQFLGGVYTESKSQVHGDLKGVCPPCNDDFEEAKVLLAGQRAHGS
jgi:hypothetical protein